MNPIRKATTGGTLVFESPNNYVTQVLVKNMSGGSIKCAMTEAALSGDEGNWKLLDGVAQLIPGKPYSKIEKIYVSSEEASTDGVEIEWLYTPY